MCSRKVIPILNQSRRFKKLPSEILRIKDEYTSYCFDEACEYILSQLDEEKKPTFLEDRKINKEKGITILMVTHSDKCAAYADRIITLSDGRLSD